MKPEPAGQDNQETELRLAGIFQRIERGDTSVTDEVFWLQAHEDLVTGPKRESPRD